MVYKPTSNKYRPCPVVLCMQATCRSRSTKWYACWSDRACDLAVFSLKPGASNRLRTRQRRPTGREYLHLHSHLRYEEYDTPQVWPWLVDIILTSPYYRAAHSASVFDVLLFPCPPSRIILLWSKSGPGATLVPSLKHSAPLLPACRLFGRFFLVRPSSCAPPTHFANCSHFGLSPSIC